MYIYNEDDDRTFAAEMAARDQYLEGYEDGYAKGVKEGQRQVERRGQWVDGMPHNNSHWRCCSVCHVSAPLSGGGYKYCPSCGAKMDEEEATT